ncbi:MAG: glycerol-3-phosphate responsive antiterminator [Clostridia bacterium]|nr:glycerol-3-phosphate responsive antiterminator [Clostridia bacterium]
MALLERVRRSPIIAAVRDLRDLRRALASTVPAVFLLVGDINSLPRCVLAAREAGKEILVHLDLIDGLGRDRAGVEFLARSVRPDGVITTRSNLIQAAKREGLFTIQRVFMLDSLSYRTAAEAVRSTGPDAVECLPGIIPRVISEFAREVSVPVVAGGMVKTAEEVRAALAAGAVAVSVSEQRLWGMLRATEESEPSA